MRDVPVLARSWHAEKPHTCFNQLDVAWSEMGCAAHLIAVLSMPNHRIFVAERDRRITAAIGITAFHHHLPPYPEVVGEWMWWGSQKRDIVRVFQAMKTYAKSIGAVLIQYTLNQPSTSGTKFTETYRWEAL